MKVMRTTARRAVAAVSAVATVVGTGLLASPALGVAGPAGPDLVVTSVTPVGMGAPPYLAIGPSGVAKRFDLRVVTKNIGTAAAPKSSTLVFMRDAKSHKVLAERRPVPSLKPGEYWIQNFQVADYKPPLGFSEAVATADYTHTVSESHETNNGKVSPPIAIVARIWDVDLFSTNQILPSLNVTTTAQPDFHFKLVEYNADDAAFEYEPVGDVQGIAIETGTCTGNGDKNYSGPFTKGFLAISGKLTSYTAFVPLSKLAPFIVNVSCLGGITYAGRFALQDLETWVGDRQRPKMTPAEAKLHDAVPNPIEHLLFAWDFRARIHG